MYGIQLIHKSQIVQKIGQKIVLKLDKNCAKNWAKYVKNRGKENCAVIQGGPPLSVKYKS